VGNATSAIFVSVPAVGIEDTLKGTSAQAISAGDKDSTPTAGRSPSTFLTSISVDSELSIGVKCFSGTKFG